MSKLKNILLLFFIVVAAYGMSVKYGFSQDDWFHLTISRANAFSDFLNFFNPFSVTWIFFRPISTQLPYWLSSTLFPLSMAPHFMHVVMLIIHIINSYLVIRISRKYLQSKTSVLLGVFYAVSSIHFLSLFYIGAVQQLISTFFSLLAIKVFLENKLTPQISLSILTLLALLSKELAIRLPAILFVLSYLREANLSSAIKSIRGPIVVTGLYFLLRFVAGSGGASEYYLSFSPFTTIATTMWYSLFLLGFPEELLHYGLSGGLINFPLFVHDHGFSAIIIVIAAIIILGFLLYQTIRIIKSKSIKQSFVFFALSIISLLPILFLPTHRYPHYLDLSILFVGIAILSKVKDISRPIIIGFAYLIVSNIVSINLESRTHWTTKRAILSTIKMQEILASGSCRDSNEMTLTGSASEILELSYAFSLANGPRVICQNPILQVYYKELP